MKQSYRRDGTTTVARKWAMVLCAGFVFLFSGISAANAEQIHRVEPGETLGLIATYYDSDVNELMRLNPFMKDPDCVVSGQALVVPEVVVDPPPVPAEGQEPADGEQQKAGTKTESVPIEAKKAPVVEQPPPKLTTAQVRLLHPSHFLVSGPRDAKRVALTFDDGPDARYTPAILDVLREQGVPASFFMIGNQIERYPEVVQRINAEGHLLASHSFTHANFGRLAPEEALFEIHSTEWAVFSLTGRLPALFRAPYGEISEENMKMLIALGYKNIFWSVDTLDWTLKDPDQVLVNALSNTRRGAIILMHSNGGRDQNLDATVDALPDLIYTLRAQGYEFVTVDQLLSVPAYRN